MMVVLEGQAVYGPGLTGQAGFFIAANHDMYPMISFGAALGYGVGVGVLYAPVYADPNTFSPKDLSGWSYSWEVSVSPWQVSTEVPVIEKWRKDGYKIHDTYLAPGGGVTLTNGAGAYWSPSFTWISNKPLVP